MKIYNLSGFAETRHRDIEHHNAVHGQRQFLRKVSGGEDMVDISAEAMRKYREHRMVELDAVRIQKLTAQVIDSIHRGDKNSDLRTAAVPGAGIVDETGARGKGDIGEEARFRETAENLLGFFIS
jgi:hypothetical protein